jgi:hypothetical protein
VALTPLLAEELSALDNLIGVAIWAVGVQLYSDTPKAITLVAHIHRLTLSGYNLKFSTLVGVVV